MPTSSLLPRTLNTRSRSAEPRMMAETFLQKHRGVVRNSPRSELISQVLQRKEAIETPSGALATWHPKHSTGRIPKDTYIVRHEHSSVPVDWNSPACHPMAPVTFEKLWDDAIRSLTEEDRIFVLERQAGASDPHALPVTLITKSPLSALFTDSMLRPRIKGGEEGTRDEEFLLLVLPDDRVHTDKYANVLRSDSGRVQDMLVAMDFDRRLGIVYGSRYLGCVKKLIFTVMNAILPSHNVLPLHCAANEARNGETALFLGLSGTGKTTLSMDQGRLLIGDDEHAWSSDGIWNMEYGCYAKLVNLRREKEPEIFDAVFDSRPVLDNGCIIENALLYPDGLFDLADTRLTENSRASYPLSFLRGVKESACGHDPSVILFLTADATGVLPPLAKLNSHQAALWFLMGYTSKLAGTEVGVKVPEPNFSRFFGAPFMPCPPATYLELFQEKIRTHGTVVYLLNTGWSGGPPGVGERMDLSMTRALRDAVLAGELRDVPAIEDPRFHLEVPVSCTRVDPMRLRPELQWKDREGYERVADSLAASFSSAFDHHFLGSVPREIAMMCPGK